MSNSIINYNAFNLEGQEMVTDDSIVVSVESTAEDTIIAVRCRSDNGYVLVRTYQLTDDERKEASANPEALPMIIKKKRIVTAEDIKKAILGAAGISST
jgi:hypothetical protein